MQTVIIDTDVAIDFLRGEPYAKGLILPLWGTNSSYLSVLTIYELHAGMKKVERVQTEDFISACTIELITTDIAIKGGELRKLYRESGVTLAVIDCLIAATALIRGHKIATRNIKHYPEKGLLMNL